MIVKGICVRCGRRVSRLEDVAERLTKHAADLRRRFPLDAQEVRRPSILDVDTAAFQLEATAEDVACHAERCEARPRPAPATEDAP